ncbi:MAG: MFS transporter [bacterium]|nr:MFS transporter [bacterium]
MILFIIGEALWGFQAGLVGSATVLSVMLQECGASKTMIGAIGGIEAFGFLLPQLIGLFLFGTGKAQKRRILWWHFVGIIPWLYVIGVLGMNVGHVRPRLLALGILGCYGLFIMGIGVVAGVWMDWIGHLFPRSWRGRVMGASWGASSAAGIIGSLVAGQVLRHFHSSSAYGWLFISAGCIAALSITTFWWVKEIDVGVTWEERRTNVGDVLRAAVMSLRHVGFRMFVVGRVMAAAGFSIVPLIAVYYVGSAGGNVTKSELVSAGAMLGLGFAVGNVVGGYLGDRYGHRLGIVVGVITQLMTLVMLLTTQGVWSCAVVYGLAGTSQGLTNLAHSNLLFETCPHDRRLVHITFGNIILGACVSPLPLVAGWVAQRHGMKVVMLLSIVCSVAALLWLVSMVREPRRQVAHE